ncbi:hypothetical protein PAXRUDRAFT_768867, partial [Paxillus rubicundulus Ve08.2h10]
YPTHHHPLNCDPQQSLHLLVLWCQSLINLAQFFKAVIIPFQNLFPINVLQCLSLFLCFEHCKFGINIIQRDCLWACKIFIKQSREWRYPGEVFLQILHYVQIDSWHLSCVHVSMMSTDEG